MMYTEQQTNRANPVVCETSVKKKQSLLIDYLIHFLNQQVLQGKKFQPNVPQQLCSRSALLEAFP